MILDVVFSKFMYFSFTITLRQKPKGVTHSRRRTGSLSACNSKERERSWARNTSIVQCKQTNFTYKVDFKIWPVNSSWCTSIIWYYSLHMLSNLTYLYIISTRQTAGRRHIVSNSWHFTVLSTQLPFLAPQSALEFCHISW